MPGHTVAEEIRTEDFQDFIKEMREKLFAIAPEALESFRTPGYTSVRFDWSQMFCSKRTRTAEWTCHRESRRR
jgi:hypothetical protein